MCVKGNISQVQETIKIPLVEVFSSDTLKLSNTRVLKSHLFLLPSWLLICLSNHH